VTELKRPSRKIRKVSRM